MSTYVSSEPFTRSSELRSIANSIEVLFPDAADALRGIAKEFEV